MAKEKYPGIILYPEDMDRIRRTVKPLYRFEVVWALTQYSVDGSMPTEEDLGEGGMVAFEFILDKVKDALETFRNNQRQRKEAIQKRWNKGTATETQEEHETNTDEYECIRTYTDEYDRIRNSSKQKQKQKQKTETETENNNSDKEKRKRFTPPPLEEVIAFALERNSPVDPNRFFDYYTSIGWMVGKNRMKDWKATFRNWEHNEFPNWNSKAQPKRDYITRNYSEADFAAMETNIDDITDNFGM